MDSGPELIYSQIVKGLFTAYLKAGHRDLPRVLPLYAGEGI